MAVRINQFGVPKGDHLRDQIAAPNGGSARGYLADLSRCQRSGHIMGALGAIAIVRR